MSKEFYPIGEHPPLGYVPKYMMAQCIRESRFGEPKDAVKIEKLPVPSDLKPHEVLVYIMAAGVNYNVVWASKGNPTNPIKYCNKKGDPENFMIPGSDAAGIVWKVGSEVKNVKVGDEIIIHGCRYDLEDPVVKAGIDQTFAPSLHMWGFETIYGALAQYTRIQDNQCMPKPKHLSWTAAACHMVTGAAAYRMFYGWPPNTLQQDDPVLIWGGSGGLGSMAIELCKNAGAKPVAVVSSPQKMEYCKKLGAVGVIDRMNFDHWGALPDINDIEKYSAWIKSVKKFGKLFWEALGEKKSPRIVFEHPGEDTLPTSLFMVDTGGMVVICGGTSGYYVSLDLRYHWVRQKRFQGSHYANDEQCYAFNKLISEKRIAPCLTDVYEFEKTAECHQLLFENKQPPGNLGILVNAKTKEE
ncbi:Crotonyl-CoA reductase [Candidatus Magnetomorum sp. HK-1]|nr:Crotonyl-CoA reductase [Candidatus Magnetomorum sp. HK-1]